MLGHNLTSTRQSAKYLRLGYIVECYSTFIVNEVLELRKLGATVTVLNAFRPSSSKDSVKESVRKESLYLPKYYSGVLTANLRCLLLKPLTYIRLAALLLREYESLRMLILAGYYARLVQRKRIQHLHATFGTRTATLAHIISRLSGVGYSFTTHAYDIFNPNPSLLWKTNSAQFMRTISRFNKQFIEENYSGVKGSQIYVLYLGVDIIKFAPHNIELHYQSSCSLISVGDLIQQKGHAFLIRACEKLARRSIDFKCSIIGEGPARRFLEQEIALSDLADRVHLLGEMNNDEVRRYLNESHIFVLACIDMRGLGEHIDGIPVALMEAMAIGMPVVSTRISGIPELIEDGVSGILVPEKDESALADALAQLIDDNELRIRLGRGARRRIAERFNLETNTQLLAGLFEEQLSAYQEHRG
jgi:glycosyltransferase involved in cell wall biosynthesis